MDNKVKRYLNNIIKESMNSHDVDEMAQKPITSSKYVPLYMHDGKTYAGEKKELKGLGAKLIGWMVDGEPILFTCGAELEDYLKDHSDMVGELENMLSTEHGVTSKIRWTNGNLTACKPRRVIQSAPIKSDGNMEDEMTTLDKGYKGPEKSQSLSTTLLRKFNSIVKSEFNEEFNKELNLRSIPAIMFERENLNAHVDEWSNQKMVFETHTFNGYENSKEFLKSVISRIKGNETENAKTYHMARQFNKFYRNWEETRKNDVRYHGKTDIYKLDYLGFEELNLDVALKMSLRITGEMIGDNSFLWTISMINKFGKKLPTETFIKTENYGKLNHIKLEGGSYLDDKKLGVTKTVQLTPGKEFNEQNPILDDINVVNGLIEAIEDFKKVITDINPKSALKVANVKANEVRPEQNINEMKNLLVNRIVRKING